MNLTFYAGIEFIRLCLYFQMVLEGTAAILYVSDLLSFPFPLICRLNSPYGKGASPFLDRGSGRCAYYRGSSSWGSVKRNSPVSIQPLRERAISKALVYEETGAVGTSRPLKCMVPLFSSA